MKASIVDIPIIPIEQELQNNRKLWDFGVIEIVVIPVAIRDGYDMPLKWRVIQKRKRKSDSSKGISTTKWNSLYVEILVVLEWSIIKVYEEKIVMKNIMFL